MNEEPQPHHLPRGPLPGAVGRLAALAYRAALDRRNRAFDAGRGVQAMPCPVISVGNLSVGGTGKTPMVAHLCRLLLERGVRPCIAMRGYARGLSRHSMGHSDEADAYRREFGGSVDIVARPDRATGVVEVLARASRRPGAVILDDGFQHRRIRRDVDVVLIDASRDPFADKLLPAGWLRELPESLNRATCVVVTHAELATSQQQLRLCENIRVAHGRPPIATTRHLWTSLRDPAERPIPLDWLLGKRVLGVCAIGNPAGFLDALAITVGDRDRPESIVLPDHDSYRAATVRRIIQRATSANVEAIVVTDKDWSKIRMVPTAAWPCPVVRPVLSLGFVDGQAALERVVLSPWKAR